MKKKFATASLMLLSVIALSAFNRVEKTTPSVAFSDSSRYQKPLLHFKKNAVKLYPNPTWSGSITVSADTTAPLHFYVFDVEGTLLHQVVLKDKQKHTIHHLKKGVYVYDAFLNDEGIEHGKIIVK